MAETHVDVIANGGDITCTLTEIEAHQLSKCEQVIKNGLSTFLTVGRALATIRDNRLYRETHQTFEKYCKEVWDLSRGYAYQQIGGYETVTLLESKMSAIADIDNENKMSTIVDVSDESKMSPIGDKTQPKIILPINEAQTRPLTKLKNPEDQIAAWDIVLAHLNDGEKLTAALIAKAVKEVRGEVLERRAVEIKNKVNTTSLLSNIFKNQYNILYDIITDEKNIGWKTCKRGEVIQHLKTMLKHAESDD